MSDIKIIVEDTDAYSTGAIMAAPETGRESLSVLLASPDDVYCGFEADFDENTPVLALIGPTQCGKTTICDLFLRHYWQHLRSHPMVSDSLIEEQQRTCTVLPSPVPCPAAHTYFIDTPGHPDLGAHAALGLALADAAVLCLDILTPAGAAVRAVLSRVQTLRTPLAGVWLTGADRLFTEARLAPADALGVVRQRLNEVADIMCDLGLTVPAPAHGGLALVSGTHGWLVSVPGAEGAIGEAGLQAPSRDAIWDNFDSAVLSVVSRIYCTVVGGVRQVVARLCEGLGVPAPGDEVWQEQRRAKHADVVIKYVMQSVFHPESQLAAVAEAGSWARGAGAGGRRVDQRWPQGEVVPMFVCKESLGSDDLSYVCRRSPDCSLPLPLPLPRVLPGACTATSTTCPLCVVSSFDPLLTPLLAHPLPLPVPPPVLSLRVSALDPARAPALAAAAAALAAVLPCVSVEFPGTPYAPLLLHASGELALDVAAHHLTWAADAELRCAAPAPWVVERPTDPQLVVDSGPGQARVRVSAAGVAGGAGTVDAACGRGWRGRVDRRALAEVAGPVAAVGADLSVGDNDCLVVLEDMVRALDTPPPLVPAAELLSAATAGAAAALAAGPVCGCSVVGAVVTVHSIDTHPGTTPATVTAVARATTAAALLLARPVLLVRETIVEVLCPSNSVRPVRGVLATRGCAGVGVSRHRGTPFVSVTAKISPEMLPGIEAHLTTACPCSVTLIPGDLVELPGAPLSRLPPGSTAVGGEAAAPATASRWRETRGLAALSPRTLPPFVQRAALAAGALPPALRAAGLGRR